MSAPLETAIGPPLRDGNHFAPFSLPYCILFVVGIAGNTSVLTYIYFVTKLDFRSLRSSVTALGNTLVYMVVLSAMDLLVTMSIPFHLSVIILENWVFGLLACKVYWMIELSNKICSSYILTALAFDRYMAICHPEVKRVHQWRQTILIVAVLVLFAAILIAPVVLSSYIKTFPLHDLTFVSRRENASFQVVRQLCVDGLSLQMKFYLMSTMMIFAFVLPCTLLTYFYFKIIIRLRRQIRTMLQSRIPIKRITSYTMSVTTFYLACQIPYWLPQVYGTMARIFNLKTPEYFALITYYTHMCPFLAAALNWILYAQLNSQFKKGLILVTERMHRKMTRSTGKRGPDTMDELCLEMMSRSDDGPAWVCPNCEHQLSVKLQKMPAQNGNAANV